MARHLSQGDRVELPGIGTFSLRLGADGPIEYRDDKQLSRRLQIRGIRFLPKQELLAAVREEARFRRDRRGLYRQAHNREIMLGGARGDNTLLPMLRQLFDNSF